MTITDDFIAKSKYSDLGRYCVTAFVKSVADGLAPGSSLLDAGAGECAYKGLFRHCDYKAADMAIGDSTWNYDHLDYKAPLDNLPIPDASFDAVLCTQVLEHLQKPLECVKEMHRVLKPGGRLFLTVPMAQDEHQTPHDYFRYTSYGLKYLCTAAGFSEVSVVPMGGMFLRWAYELPRALRMFPKARNSGASGIRLAGVLLYPLRVALGLLIPVCQAMLLFLDRFDTVRNDPWGWELTARK